MTASAAGLAALAVLVALPGTDAALRRLHRSRARATAAERSRHRRRALVVVAVLGLGLATASGSGGPRAALVVLGAAAAAAVGRRVARLSRQRRQRRRRQRTTIDICDGLAAEMRAGLPALTALLRTCGGTADLQPVVSAARLGGDIPTALRACGASPGAEGLRALAAAWEVAISSGAALATVLERLAEGLRSDEDARAEVVAALGPPRATAKMLAGLPLAGVAMGESMGSSPLSFLFGTSWGLGCLAAGVVLALAGIWWVELLAAAAER